MLTRRTRRILELTREKSRRTTFRRDKAAPQPGPQPRRGKKIHVQQLDTRFGLGASTFARSWKVARFGVRVDRVGGGDEENPNPSVERKYSVISTEEPLIGVGLMDIPGQQLSD